METIEKFIEKGNPQWNMMKDVGCSQSKIWCKEMGWVKNEYILVNHERHQNVKIETSNWYDLKIVSWFGFMASQPL